MVVNMYNSIGWFPTLRTFRIWGNTKGDDNSKTIDQFVVSRLLSFHLHKKSLSVGPTKSQIERSEFSAKTRSVATWHEYSRRGRVIGAWLWWEISFHFQFQWESRFCLRHVFLVVKQNCRAHALREQFCLEIVGGKKSNVCFFSKKFKFCALRNRGNHLANDRKWWVIFNTLWTQKAAHFQNQIDTLLSQHSSPINRYQ